jgi:hypothetical protein
MSVIRKIPSVPKKHILLVRAIPLFPVFEEIQMSNFIKLPNGDAVSNAVIKSVRYVKDRGVVCSDAQLRMVVWIEEKDVEKGHRIRDFLIKFVQDPRGITQPDWSFLNEQKSSVAKS